MNTKIIDISWANSEELHYIRQIMTNNLLAYLFEDGKVLGLSDREAIYRLLRPLHHSGACKLSNELLNRINQIFPKKDIK